MSQVYFKGDPYVEGDTWASDPSAKLRIFDMTLIAGALVLS